MATVLTKGANIALQQLAPDCHNFDIALGWRPYRYPGMEVDTSAFLLTDAGQVRNDADMVFYNQPQTPDGTVALLPGQGEDQQRFRLQLAGVPDSINKFAFTVTLHEGQARHQSFGMLEAAWARVTDDNGNELTRFELPLTDTPETAMIFCEVYRHRDTWKFRAVGQGFVGGLKPLAEHFGIQVDEDEITAAEPPSAPIALATTEHSSEPTSAPPPIASPPLVAPAPADTEADNQHRVRLEKRIISLEKKDPGLVSLVKRAGIQLEKRGLGGHQAKVALCLDISGSMHGLYSRGSMDVLVQRLLALGFLFDDDGEIDVFLFGSEAYSWGGVNADNYKTFIKDMLRQRRLEGGTYYGKAMALVREHYHQQETWGEIPIYVMFATDGDTFDQTASEQQIIEAAHEGIFWQFMAIGTPAEERKGFFSRLLASDFKFLAHLDTMSDRIIDNANFFLVRDPAEPSDEALYEYLMAEYPDWLQQAHRQGILRQR